MNEYFAARRIYRKNVLIGITICLFINVFGTDVLGPSLNWPQEDVYTVFPLLAMVFYFVYSRIRKGTKKEDAYTGKLRLMPKLFMGYIFISMMYSLALLDI